MKRWLWSGCAGSELRYAFRVLCSTGSIVPEALDGLLPGWWVWKRSLESFIPMNVWCSELVSLLFCDVTPLGLG